VAEGVVVEVGGTSTNVAAVKRGRPLLSYVQVASHSTALRAVDVRVIRVAGGSMLRPEGTGVRRRAPERPHRQAALRRLQPVEALDGARVELIAPRPGDPADHLVVVRADGQRWP
jgi:hypothetical protein